ncbi:MAG: glycosyltransferase family 2 protein [Candidatus Omnitrophica bacterium]|nr:glycosyltransferase family 2 protein [Candidatus Omnitrophota bacterium]
MSKGPLVYIVVLSFNGEKWLDGCLSTVSKTKYENFRIIAVDNGSTDESAVFIQENYPQIKLIRNEKNLGYGEGINTGIRHALKNHAEYVVVLNQDTKVDPLWVTEMLKTAYGDKSIGILSPFQYNYDGTALDENFSKTMLKNDLFRKNYHDHAVSSFYEINNIVGAALMITRGCLEKVGLYDPFYFCYGEDRDLYSRAQFHNYRLAAVRDSKIYHWHGSLEHKKAESPNARFIRGYLIFCLKDLNRVFLGNLMRCIKTTLSLMKKYGPRHFFKILVVQLQVLCYLPLILIKRSKEKKEACYL